MSNSGKLIGESNTTMGLLSRTWNMVDAGVLVANGVWIEFAPCKVGSLLVKGLAAAGGTLQLCASNDEVIPANNTDGTKVGADITADGIVAITSPYRFLKVKTSAYGGTPGLPIDVRLQGAN